MGFTKENIQFISAAFILLQAVIAKNESVFEIKNQNESRLENSTVSGTFPDGGAMIFVGFVIALYDVIFSFTVVLAFYFYCRRRNDFLSHCKENNDDHRAKTAFYLWRSKVGNHERADSKPSVSHHEDFTITWDSTCSNKDSEISGTGE